MSANEPSPLGRKTVYAERYDPNLLFPIARAAQRDELGIAGTGPFQGVDLWRAYEMSWLDPRGKPQVAMAELRIPADSPRLIESKSLKLYLNSFNGERLDTDTLLARIRHDLSAAAGTDAAVDLIPPHQFATQSLDTPDGAVIDDLDIGIDCYGPPQPDFLETRDAQPVTEALVSHLLKSNCPVTGQPDWGTLYIHYQGAPIDHAGLLRYVVSFRQHAEFHEHCVERIFTDLQRHCAPQTLTVQANYTRRGGLDINPFRSSEAGARPHVLRTARQ